MAAEPAPPPGPGVFVTVGTTEFDALVAAATAPPFLARLEALGFAWLRLQVGRGAAPHRPAASTVNNTHVSWFRFTRDLPGEMARAHIVVSHAGAGSILEALELKRRLVVVPNGALMDDHQAELAGAQWRHHDGRSREYPLLLLEGRKRGVVEEREAQSVCLGVRLCWRLHRVVETCQHSPLVVGGRL